MPAKEAGHARAGPAHAWSLGVWPPGRGQLFVALSCPVCGPWSQPPGDTRILLHLFPLRPTSLVLVRPISVPLKLLTRPPFWTSHLPGDTPLCLDSLFLPHPHPSLPACSQWAPPLRPERVPAVRGVLSPKLSAVACVAPLLRLREKGSHAYCQPPSPPQNLVSDLTVPSSV